MAYSGNYYYYSVPVAYAVSVVAYPTDVAVAFPVHFDSAVVASSSSPAAAVIVVVVDVVAAARPAVHYTIDTRLILKLNFKCRKKIQVKLVNFKAK